VASLGVLDVLAGGLASDRRIRYAPYSELAE